MLIHHCDAPGCGELVTAAQVWCSSHRAGLEGRYWPKVDRRDGGCWLWTAGTSNTGYGSILGPGGRKGKRLHAHRVAYMLHVGPIPSGLVIDHLCRNHRCVNPDHLEAVTNRENILRGISPAAQQAQQTACSKCGGPFDDGVDHCGRRRCIACRRKYHTELTRRLRAEARAC